MKKLIDAAIAITMVTLSPSSLWAQGEPSALEDSAIMACEMSRFKGKTAYESGFVRQATTIAGSTVSMLYEGKGGTMIEAECAFQLREGKYWFAGDMAPHIDSCLRYLRLQAKWVPDLEFCKSLTGTEPYYRKLFTDETVAPLTRLGVYPIDPDKTALTANPG